jgi:hypothetical protein
MAAPMSIWTATAADMLWLPLGWPIVCIPAAPSAVITSSNARSAAAHPGTAITCPPPRPNDQP